MNKEMNILKGFGIIFVVMGHVYSHFKLFPPYSFHMALFIFVSGYFYNTKYEENPLYFIKKKCKSLLLPYFIYNAIYAYATFLYYRWYQASFEGLLSFKRFFIMPFLNGYQYLFIVPAWFVIALFLIQITFFFSHKYLSKLIKSSHAKLVFYLVTSLIGIFITTKGYNTGIYLPILRTCFGLFFFYLGHYYKENLEQKKIVNPLGLICIIIVQLLLLWRFDNINYGLALGSFNREFILLPIITSITGIYSYLFLSKLLVKLWPKGNLLALIGNHSFSIMINHTVVFLLINLPLVKILNLDYINIVMCEYYHKLDKYWIWYVLAGVFIPTFASVIFRFLFIRLRSTLARQNDMPYLRNS